MLTAIERRQSSASERRTFDVSILALVLAGFTTFVDVYTTMALLPYLRRVYNASEVEVGMTIGATTLAVALVAPFIGLFSESIGRKKVIVPAIFCLSVPTFLAATSPNLHMLIFWRFMQGVFIPGIIAVIIAYINEEFAGRGVGRAMSAYVTGTVAGGFVGRLMPGVIALHFPWRWAFIVQGVITLLGGFGVRRWLPKAVHFKKNTDLGAAFRDLFAHFRNRRLIATWAMGFMVLFVLVGLFSYVNFHLAEPPYNLNSAQLGSIFFVYLLGMVVTPLAGRFMDRNGFLKTVVLSVLILSAGLVATLAHSLPVIIFGLAIASTGIFICQAAGTSQTGRVSLRARSSAAGLYVSFYYIGGSAGSVVPAFAWRHWLWPGCVGVLFAAACLLLVFARAAEIRDA
ncbi:MAG TPA: MFS transporter [candidate division Zixibacteria bacterium]|nr:MFS transporter [candidate division Zixibacteria bacterium]